MANGDIVVSLVDVGLARALEVANSQTTNFVNWVNSANNVASDALSASTTPPTSRPSVPSSPSATKSRDSWIYQPEVDIPRRANGTDMNFFTSASRKIVDDLVRNFSDFYSRYIPNDTAALNAAQQWLVDTINNGGTGIPIAVENQIWQRDRARVLTDVARAQEEVFATFSARGFPLPPGAMAHQVHLMQREGLDKIAQASRDVAIEQARIAIENIKFAVEQALNFRLRAIEAASNYLRALALGPEIASRLSLNQADAQARLISAASQFYQSRISFVEMEHDFQKHRERQRYERDIAVMQNLTQQFGLRNDIISERAKTLAATVSGAAQSAGTMASAALNSMNTSAAVTARAELDG